MFFFFISALASQPSSQRLKSLPDLPLSASTSLLDDSSRFVIFIRRLTCFFSTGVNFRKVVESVASHFPGSQDHAIPRYDAIKGFLEKINYKLPFRQVISHFVEPNRLESIIDLLTALVDETTLFYQAIQNERKANFLSDCAAFQGIIDAFIYHWDTVGPLFASALAIPQDDLLKRTKALQKAIRDPKTITLSAFTRVFDVEGTDFPGLILLANTLADEDITFENALKVFNFDFSGYKRFYDTASELFVRDNLTLTNLAHGIAGSLRLGNFSMKFLAHAFQSSFNSVGLKLTKRFEASKRPGDKSQPAKSMTAKKRVGKAVKAVKYVLKSTDVFKNSESEETSGDLKSYDEMAQAQLNKLYKLLRSFCEDSNADAEEDEEIDQVDRLYGVKLSSVIGDILGCSAEKVEKVARTVRRFFGNEATILKVIEEYLPRFYRHFKNAQSFFKVFAEMDIDFEKASNDLRSALEGLPGQIFYPRVRRAFSLLANESIPLTEFFHAILRLGPKRLVDNVIPRLKAWYAKEGTFAESVENVVRRLFVKDGDSNVPFDFLTMFFEAALESPIQDAIDTVFESLLSANYTEVRAVVTKSIGGAARIAEVVMRHCQDEEESNWVRFLCGNYLKLSKKIAEFLDDAYVDVESVFISFGYNGRFLVNRLGNWLETIDTNSKTFTPFEALDAFPKEILDCTKTLEKFLALDFTKNSFIDLINCITIVPATDPDITSDIADRRQLSISENAKISQKTKISEKAKISQKTKISQKVATRLAEEIPEWGLPVWNVSCLFPLKEWRSRFVRSFEKMETKEKLTLKEALANLGVPCDRVAEMAQRVYNSLDMDISHSRFNDLAKFFELEFAPQARILTIFSGAVANGNFNHEKLDSIMENIRTINDLMAPIYNDDDPTEEDIPESSLEDESSEIESEEIETKAEPEESLESKVVPTEKEQDEVPEEPETVRPTKQKVPDYDDFDALSSTTTKRMKNQGEDKEGGDQKFKLTTVQISLIIGCGVAVVVLLLVIVIVARKKYENLKEAHVALTTTKFIQV